MWASLLISVFLDIFIVLFFYPECPLYFSFLPCHIKKSSSRGAVEEDKHQERGKHSGGGIHLGDWKVLDYIMAKGSLSGDIYSLLFFLLFLYIKHYFRGLLHGFLFPLLVFFLFFNHFLFYYLMCVSNLDLLWLTIIISFHAFFTLFFTPLYFFMCIFKFIALWLTNTI